MNEEINKNLKRNKMLTITSIVSLIIILLGSTYAFFTYSKSSEAFVVTSGSIEASFIEGTNAITFENAYPISDSFALTNLDKLTYIDFTVSSSVSDDEQAVAYEIYLTEEGTNTLSSDYVKVYLTDDTNNQIVAPSIYSSLTNTTDSTNSNGKVIYKDSNPGTVSKKYRLYVWLDSSYTQNEVSQTFTFKVNLYAYNSINYPIASELLISKLGTGGLVAINTDGTLYDSSDSSQVIREYRYSGATANNYVIFNDDGDATEKEDNELWRIVGVFKNSSGEWNLKLMRDTVLTTDELPETYVYNGTTYTIENGTTGNVYWNNPDTFKSTNYNDWTTASLQYFLNTASDTNGTSGYYATFSDKAKALIDTNYTYHLGNVYYDSTTIDTYNAERGNVVCSTDVTENSHTNNCNIWNGNQPTLNAAIGLLYPSDYGYSADSSYWNSTTLYNYNGGAMDTSWMHKTANHSTIEWFLSPSSDSVYVASDWDESGFVYNSYVLNGSLLGARVGLNLISEATMIDAEGTLENPYVIIE